MAAPPCALYCRAGRLGSKWLAAAVDVLLVELRVAPLAGWRAHAAVATLLIELRAAPLPGWRASAALPTPLMQLRVAVDAVGGVGAADAAAVVVVV